MLPAPSDASIDLTANGLNGPNGLFRDDPDRILRTARRVVRHR